MNQDEIINTAISELKKSDKVYKMLKDFSFMNGLEQGDGQWEHPDKCISAVVKLF